MRTFSFWEAYRKCLIVLLLGAVPQVGVSQHWAPPAGPPGGGAFASLEAGLPDWASAPAFADFPAGSEISFDSEPADDAAASGLAQMELAEPESAFPFGYDLRESNLSWLVGDGDDFGIFSLESFPSLSLDNSWGIAAGMGFHFLGGPVQTDMPPRLFDFQVGVQGRKLLRDDLGYDISVRVGAFSDFEGSAREGVRFPGHGVAFYRWSPLVDLVLGIEYLDRDDISLLPVAGVIVTPTEKLRLELVFPRPRVELSISPTQSIYVLGELGGGTWAIERTTLTDDVVTYRDLRIVLGMATRGDDGHNGGLEIGYVFGRELSYRSGLGDYAPDSTVLIRLAHRY